jgi:hypothetical protein
LQGVNLVHVGFRILPGIYGGAVAVLLAACSSAGNSPLAPPARSNQPSLGMYAGGAGATYAYVDDLYGNFVDAFDRHGNIVSKITNGINAPQGLYVDAAHNLWVANAYGNNVLIFPPGSSVATRTLDDGSGTPSDVVVAADGTAYVANTTGTSGFGSIEVYPPGKNEPVRSLQDPNASQNLFITMDAKENLFVAVFKYPIQGGLGGRVDEYVGAQQSGFKRLPMKTAAPGGIRVHGSRLLVCDTTRQTVREFTEAGRPTGRVLVTGGSWSGFDVDRDGDALLGANQSFLEGVERAFPGETVEQTYTDPNFQSPVDAVYASGQKGR